MVSRKDLKNNLPQPFMKGGDIWVLIVVVFSTNQNAAKCKKNMLGKTHNERSIWNGLIRRLSVK